jgi:hypothetical protein
MHPGICVSSCDRRNVHEPKVGVRPLTVLCHFVEAYVQVTRWGIDRASSDVMSGILNCVCPECGGTMGEVGREFKCQGECQTDWRQLWEQIVSAGVNQPTPKATSRVDLNGWAPS